MTRHNAYLLNHLDLLLAFLLVHRPSLLLTVDGAVNGDLAARAALVAFPNHVAHVAALGFFRGAAAPGFAAPATQRPPREGILVRPVGSRPVAPSADRSAHDLAARDAGAVGASVVGLDDLALANQAGVIVMIKHPSKPFFWNASSLWTITAALLATSTAASQLGWGLAATGALVCHHIFLFCDRLQQQAKGKAHGVIFLLR